VALGSRERRGRSDSGELAGDLGRGNGWGGSRVHEGSIWLLTRSRERTGRRAWRKPVAGAAGSSAPTNWQLSLANKREGELRGILGRVGAACIGSESGRSQGFTVGTKAATKAAWWLGASGNARGGELDSFYRRSCLGEGVTVWRKGGARHDGQWQPRGGVARVRRRAQGRRRSTAVRP
jgi:hypothetical protein